MTILPTWAPWHKVNSYGLNMKSGEISYNILIDHPFSLFSKEVNHEF